jgi:hypothetical protein
MEPLTTAPNSNALNPAFHHVGILGISLLTFGLVGCSTKVDSGRNSDPGHWQTDDSQSGQDQSNTGQSTSNGQTSTGTNSSNSSEQATNLAAGQTVSGRSCLRAAATELSSPFKQLCETEIAAQPVLNPLADYICNKKYLSSVASMKTCGWDGSPGNEKLNYVRYEEEPKGTANPYYEIHATMLHVPVSAERMTRIVGAAFENFTAFKAKGFLWHKATDENSNINGGKFDATGLRYRFRAHTDTYEYGFGGSIRLIKLDDHTWAHINISDGEYNRIIGMQQIAIYAELPDHSSIVAKIERKVVESNGLYDRVRSTAYEAATDFMNIMFTNATNGVEP